jgi:hypothetical protein
MCLHIHRYPHISEIKNTIRKDFPTFSSFFSTLSKKPECCFLGKRSHTMNAVADEHQPLLGPILEDGEDAISVKHDGITETLEFHVDDPEDPRQWKKSFRWFIVLLLAFMAFTV